MFIEKNLNPKGELIGDCLIRALAGFTKRPYKDIKDELYDYGKKHHCVFNSRSSIYSFCSKYGLTVHTYKENEKKLAKKYGVKTIKGLTKQNINRLTKEFKGNAVVITYNHAVHIEDGNHYDTWDSKRCFARFMITK